MHLAISRLMSIQRVLLLAAALTVLLYGAPSATEPHALSAALTLPSPAPVADAADSAVYRAAESPIAADESRLASEYLDTLKAKYRYLQGVTVSIDVTPHGEEAVAYYTEGEIVISRAHVTGITTILDHEVWHVIDWHDNGRLDWGEQLPPSDSHSYATK